MLEPRVEFFLLPTPLLHQGRRHNYDINAAMGTILPAYVYIFQYKNNS